MFVPVVKFAPGELKESLLVIYTNEKEMRHKTMDKVCHQNN
jgi:hypothetical protein